MHVCPECGEGFPEPGYCPRDGIPRLSNADDPLLGLSVGNYRITRLLGAGGMGRVYKAAQPNIGSRVAVKVLAMECAGNRELVERFFDEARAVNLIRHESIVNVLDLATLPDGRPYIVMEYLDGVPLTSIMERRGPLPLGSLAKVIGEALDALSAAHAKGIVHRDLKPDNIYVSPTGRAKVLDFGIAKLVPELTGARSGPTRTGSLLGTPHYMSPEQALSQHVDQRTDVYSIGVILYEGATGRKPFEAASLFDLLRMHIEATPAAPRALRPDLPPAYEAVIWRALQKNPAQRFQSAAELAAALAEVTQQLPPDAWAPLGTVSGQGAAIGASGTPRPGSWSGAQPPPSNTMGNSAGEVRPAEAAAGKGGKKGLWIAVGVVAVAGIVIAAVAANRGGSAATGGGTEVAAAEAAPDEKDEGEKPEPAAATETATATPTPTPTGTETATATATATGSGSEAGTGSGSGSVELASGKAGFGSIDAGTAPAGGAAPAGGSAVIAVAATIDAAPAAPPPPPGPPVPPGIDLKHFDVTAGIAAALAEAQEEFPDAKFVRLDAEGVGPDGFANLTLGDNFSVLYRFQSPEKSKRPADLPIGVDYEGTCIYYVNWDGDDGHRGYALEGWKCDYEYVGIPKCSVKQVWDKAIAKGAPAQNAVASIGYWADPKGRGRWLLDVKGVFSEWIPDNCK